MRVPRKLKKKIPKGWYCYTMTGKTSKTWNEEYQIWVPTYHTKTCIFYENVDFGRCKLFNCDVLDQTKSCNIKFDY